MKLKKFLKFWYYSGSLKFALLAKQSHHSIASHTAKISDRKINISLRTGTEDTHVLYEILFRRKKSDYFSEQLPSEQHIKTILDIGANIGAAMIFFKSIYPNAKVVCFEPIPGNLEILNKNTSNYLNIEIHKVALSSSNREIKMIASPGTGNEGGWSMFQRGAKGDEQTITVKSYNSGEYLNKIGINSPDLIKVDTEGAEKDILMSLNPAQLSNTKYITGELHGERDFELLDWLEKQGFDIEMKKSFNKPLFIFKAIRKNFINSSKKDTGQ